MCQIWNFIRYIVHFECVFEFWLIIIKIEDLRLKKIKKTWTFAQFIQRDSGLEVTNKNKKILIINQSCTIRYTKFTFQDYPDPLEKRAQHWIGLG